MHNIPAATKLPPWLEPVTFAPQVIWLAIFFIALYLILSRIALPRVGAVLDQRASRLSDDLAEAARLRDDTAAAIASYEQALVAAKARGHAIAAKNREEIAEDLIRQRHEADEQIGAKLADAEMRIHVLKNEASVQIGEIATETAHAVVARLLGATVDKAELQGAVNEALGK
jgi:F-type H+-transporting ATPase subunit b